MALGDTIYLLLNRAIVGVGLEGQIIGPLTETAQTEAWVAAGIATVNAGPGAVVTTPASFLRSSGSTVFTIGDSITLNGTLQGHGFTDTVSGALVFGPLSFLGLALPFTAGRFRFAGVAATHGYTSAQVLATHLPPAVQSKADYVHILAGTNDIGVLTFAQTKANVQAMVQAIVDAGKQPILATIPPQDANNTGATLLQITQTNLWLRAYAAANKFALVDYHATLVNPATNQYAAGLQSDGIHPTSAGAKLMAAALATVLNSLSASHRPVGVHDAYNPSLLLPDCCQTSTTTGEKWTTAGGTTGAFFGGGAGVSTYKGASTVIVRGSAADLTLLAPTAGATSTQRWTAGDKVRLAYLLDVSAVPAAGIWQAGLYDETDNAMICGYQAMDRVLTTGSVSVVDCATTSASKVITSASAPFRPSHVGLPVSVFSSGIVQEVPAGTVITGVSLDGTQAELSAAATATAAGCLCTVLSPYLTVVFEFTVPAVIVGHTIDFRYSAQTTQGVAIGCAQVTVTDQTALGVSA